MKQRSRSKSIVSGLMCVALVAVLGAQTPALNVKLGLWDMTMTIDMSGMMAGMTPEQQAQAAAMMRGRSMAMPPMQMKTCMTADKLRDAHVAPERPGQTCTSKIIKATSTLMDYTETCTGTVPSTS